MTNLALQGFLRNGGSPQDLKTQLGINYKYYSKHPNLVLFKYDQKQSHPNHPIVVECRGIIVDQDDNWNVVARGFNRFFNYGEDFAAEVDWSNCKVQEKVDGSLCLMFFYKGDWHVATSGSLNTHKTKFGSYFWETFFKLTGHSKPDGIEKQDFCFIFELTGPHNHVVVPHMQNNLTLLGARNVSTWQEVHPTSVSHFFPGISVVRELPIGSVEEAIKTFDTLSPLEQEGYVLVWSKKDGSFDRVKIKHPDYVLLHHSPDKWTYKTCVEVLQSGELAEVEATVLKKYPQYRAMLEEVKSRYDQLIASAQADYITHGQMSGNAREFAASVKNSKYSDVLFRLKSGKIGSVQEYFSKYRTDSLMQLLGYNSGALDNEEDA